MLEHVLLIGPDADAATAVRRALDEAGFGVHRVATGEEGLAFLAANPVAGIVLDHCLALDDGLHMLRQLRERFVRSPTIVISSPGSTELAIKAVKAGAFDFVERDDRYLPVLVAKVRAAVAEFAARGVLRGVVRPAFVGRESELRVLDEELTRAIAGEGRVVLVIGEEGIGKTSLALEITRVARARGSMVLWGQCHDAGGTPAYWPWIQILRRYLLAADPGTLRADLGDGAAALACILPALRERCPDIPAGDVAELTRFHVVDGVTQFLKRVAARRSLVLIFDDINRADRDSLHLFRFVASESADTPLLLLGAYRERGKGGARFTELSRVAGQPLTTVLRLEGFKAEDVRRYVEEATTVRPSQELAAAIHAKTEGNPLFVAEVARLLAADGRLSDDPGNGGFRLAIPATRREAIAARVERLSLHAQRLLGVAAVIGYDFTPRLLARVSGEEPRPVHVALAEAIDEHLVTANDDEPDAYRFSHVLVRDVLYQGLSPSERPMLHAQVAEGLEAASNDGARSDPSFAAIAHHYLEAATDTEGLQRALDWVVAAGDHAAAMMAHDEAARHYSVALHTAERAGITTPTQMTELLVKLAEARWRGGDMQGAREAGQRALGLAKQAGDPAAITAAALTFAGRLPGFAAIVSDAEVVSELEQALALLPRSATALRALVMARLAEELAYSPRRGAHQTLGQQAIELARGTGDPAVLAAVLRTSQWSVWSPDDIERRRQLATEIVSLAAQTGDRVLALDGQLLRLWSALEHGEMDVAWRQLDRTTRMAAELRLPHYAWVTGAARACLHIATGRLDEAERLAEQASEAGERVNSPTVTLMLGAQRAYVRALRGRFGEVNEWFQGVLAGFPVLAAAMDCWVIIFYARTGQHDRVRTELAELAADDFARVPRNAMWLMNMTFLAVACTLTGDAEAARHLYPQLAPFTPYNVVMPPAFVEAPVSYYIAGLAALMGNESAARRHYEDALALAGQTGSRQWVARTQIAYARLLLGSGSAADRERGAQLVASGRAIADELGMEPAVQEADAVRTSALPRDAERGTFRQAGDTWEITFHDQSATVSHRVGMTYIRCLLERPGVPIAALELASLGGESILVDRSGGPRIDRKAMAEVQHRLAEIDADIADCARRGSTVSAALLHERSEYARYLSGRSSELVSAADRARTCVTKAIGRALKAIRSVHEGFGHHLERHIETGRLCVYVPDPAAPVTFEF